MKLLSHTGVARKERPLVAAREHQRSRNGLARIRLVLGGAICGGFLGSFAGALFGVVCGTWAGDLSLGLDGTVIGGMIVAVFGAVYGLVCATKGRPEDLNSERPT
jgi:hypothetical protein